MRLSVSSDWNTVLRMKIAIAVCVLMLAIAAAGQSAEMKQLVDDDLGFELSYPAVYSPQELPCSDARSFARQGGKSILYATTGSGRDIGTLHITVGRRPFRQVLEEVSKHPPTGWEKPKQIQVGKHTFYYYGRGGGGVAYPDQYYFNLRGYVLQITFDGPYPPDNNTPTKATKDFERKMLESFRLRDAS
jgi:hypothetical protein